MKNQKDFDNTDIIKASVISSIIDKDTHFRMMHTKKQEIKHNRKKSKFLNMVSLQKAYRFAYDKFYLHLMDDINSMDETEIMDKKERERRINNGKLEIIDYLMKNGHEHGCIKYLENLNKFPDILASFFLDANIFTFIVLYFITFVMLIVVSFSSEEIKFSSLIPMFTVAILNVLALLHKSLIKKLQGKKCTCQKCLLKQYAFHEYSRELFIYIPWIEKNKDGNLYDD